MNLEALESQAGAAESLLKTVANKRRLVILCELLAGEKSVTALRGAIGLSQSALSQHLAVLRKHKLVKTRRDAQMIFYSLRGSEAPAILGALYELYCRSPKPVCDDLPAGRRRRPVRSKRSLAAEAS